MNVYLVLLHLGGAVALLLWAVRMVRTGVERAWEPRLRRLLRESRAGRLRAAAVGAGAAVLLQSATAVALLAAGLAGSGALAPAIGLALMLGADLGSALVVQVLSLDLGWLVPVLLIAGAVLFFRGPNRNVRQGGRILLGLALILVSLQMIGAATAPLRDHPALPAVMGYLGGDLFTAFLIGAAFTWAMHSSVAAVLMVAAFAGQGLLPAEVAVALALGANLGGGLVAVGLTRAAGAEARRIVLGNLIFRGLGALLALLVLRYAAPPLDVLGAGARLVVNAHLGFNLALVLLCLPLAGPVGRLAARLVRDRPADPDDVLPAAGSALDGAAIASPPLALAGATRELLRMAEIVERMLGPLMEIYETGDREKIRQARRMEAAVDQAQSEIKLYLARIDFTGVPEEEARHGQALADFAINLEHVGDAVTKTLLRLAETRRDQQLSFSPEGWRELGDLHHRVMSNMRLALNVLVSRDRESARRLLAEKDAMREAERASHARHLDRLRAGAAQSIATSDLHLETARALKTINSLLASVAYPILSETGDLLDSRLARQP